MTEPFDIYPFQEPLIFDTHAHYDDQRFDDERDDLFKSLRQHGVAKIVNCGCDIESSLKTLEIAKKFDYVYAAVGYHPCNIDNDICLDKIAQLANNKKCVAIGEIGLDYYWTRDNIDKQLKELSLLNKDLANPDNANKLKQIAIADYLLIITTDSFNASTTTKTLELTGEKITIGSANIELSYKLIETATMDIVASGSDSTDMSLGAGASCSSVVSSMTKKLSKSLSEDLLNQIK